MVRNAPRIERESVSQEALAAYREHHEGIPHVLGLMDAEMIAARFDLGASGTRYPGEWSARGKLLPAPAGTTGSRKVWGVEDVKACEELILKHLARRRLLAGERRSKPAA